MAHSETYRRAYEKLKAGDYDEAKQLFLEDERSAGTATETRALVQRAQGRLAEGDVNGAAALYEQLLDRNPAIPEVYFGLVRISLFTGQLDAARVHATAALRLAPHSGLAHTLMGLVREVEKNLPGALEELERGVKASPGEFLCQFNLGRVLAAAGRPQDGIAPLTRATQLDPRNPDGFYTLGMVLKQAGRDEDAVRALGKAAELSPKNADAWATLADVLFGMRDFQRAREALDRGLGAVGDHPALLEKAVATSMMLSDAQGAVRYVERELRAAPDHVPAWVNLANLCLLTGDLQRSESAAREALKRDPNSWEAYFHLGNLYEAMPLEAKAEEAYRKAVELSPDNWKPITNLAGLLLQMSSKEKNAQAVPLLEKAAGMAPRGEWRVQYNLALAHVRLGARDKALEIARQIQREAQPGDPMVGEAKKLESNLLEAARAS